MIVNVTSNTRAATATIQADQKSISKAQVRALNKTAVNLRVGAGREIRKIYNVKAGVIRRASKLLRARLGSRFPTAEVSFSGRPIPLIEFGAKQNKRGVSVRISKLRGRKTRKSAFITTTRRGTTGVFERTGKARFPIKQLRSIGIPVMVSRDAIEKTLLRLASNRYDVNFAHELQFELSKRR